MSIYSIPNLWAQLKSLKKELNFVWNLILTYKKFLFGFLVLHGGLWKLSKRWAPEKKLVSTHVICDLRGATSLSSKLTLFKGCFYHIKNDRNFSGSKTVTIIKSPQLCAYKAPPGLCKFKLHFCLKRSW